MVQNARSYIEENLPDIQILFHSYNRQYFNNAIRNVKIKWTSSLPSSSVGTYSSYGSKWPGLICLNKNVLCGQPWNKIYDALLHEMIHAYLDAKGEVDGNPHGPRFIAEMKRINRLRGSNITVVHKVDELTYPLVNHWWASSAHPPTWPSRRLLTRQKVGNIKGKRRSSLRPPRSPLSAESSSSSENASDGSRGPFPWHKSSMGFPRAIDDISKVRVRSEAYDRRDIPIQCFSKLSQEFTNTR